MVENHPRLVTFGLGLAITFGISAAFGLVEGQQALADYSYCRKHTC